jgi:hypothetical protein
MNESSSPTTYHILEGLKQTLACTGDIVFCGEASTSQEVLKRPFTPEEKGEISSRLDSLEGDINRVW